MVISFDNKHVLDDAATAVHCREAREGMRLLVMLVRPGWSLSEVLTCWRPEEDPMSKEPRKSKRTNLQYFVQKLVRKGVGRCSVMWRAENTKSKFGKNIL